MLRSLANTMLAKIPFDLKDNLLGSVVGGNATIIIQEIHTARASSAPVVFTALPIYAAAAKLEGTAAKAVSATF